MSEERDRLRCENCGATFAYTPQREVSLPPHNCTARRRARIEGPTQ